MQKKNNLNSSTSKKQVSYTFSALNENHEEKNKGEKKPTNSSKKSNKYKQKKSPSKNRSFQKNRFRMAKKQKEDKIPSAGDNIRIIPLSGVEEIGRNMTVVEYKDEIIIVDCGIQFSEEDTPGIDFILPNSKYLEERKDKIKGIFITHGHMDHIGAIPYLIEKLGNPQIYTGFFSTLMIKKNRSDFPELAPYKMNEVKPYEKIKAGNNLSVRFFPVTHTIPSSMGLIIDTPLGGIAFTGDLKIDHKEGIPTEEEEKRFNRFKDEDILLLIADSTNIEKTGFSLPEKVVHENIKEIIKETKDRLIIATFSTQLDRIIKIVEASEKCGKKVAIDGRSMKENVEIAKEIGYLKCQKGTMISIDEISEYPPEEIVALVTGSQGDEYAALMRISNKNHRHIQINKKDTVLLSSSVIPGNERAVQKLKDNLSRQGAKIIHNSIADIHSSGHAYQDEMRWIHKKIGAKFFMPVHGYHYMLTLHAEIAKSVGVPKDNIIIPDNGSIIEIEEEGKKIKRLKESAPSTVRMVDGLSIGETQEVVIRDRKMLAQDGMFVIIASIDLKTGKLRKSPDIISRGFLYLKESQDLLHQSRIIIKKTIEKITSEMHPINFDYIKEQLTEEMSKFLIQKTNKHPVIIPVIIGL